MAAYAKTILLLVAFILVLTALVYGLIRIELHWLAILVAGLGIAVGFYGYSKAARLFLSKGKTDEQ